MPQLAVTGSHSPGGNMKRHIGILEVKMKHRLNDDASAVAIGAVKKNSSNPKLNTKKLRKPHRLPLLQALNGDKDRPITYKKEREQVMNDISLPSPTKSIVQSYVESAKRENAKRLAKLPPVAGVYRVREAQPSLFPQAYHRGELPIMLESKAGGQTLRWTNDMAELDFSKYFPLFLDGMRERGHPYHFLAHEGAIQLLQFGRKHPEKVVVCIPNVVPPLRKSLELRDEKSIRDVLSILQQLSLTNGVGPLLVPYYRQLLPVLNLFKGKRRNLGDSMDFKQSKAKDLGEMITETLEIMEKTGGPDAYVNIKYMVPTYESVQLNIR